MKIRGSIRIILTILLAAAFLFFFVGCGGGGSSTDTTDDGGTDTGTDTTFNNEYMVLYSGEGGGKLSILPTNASTPEGYEPAALVRLQFIDSEGNVVSINTDSTGRFDAEEIGIPLISSEGSLENVSVVDVNVSDTAKFTGNPVPALDLGSKLNRSADEEGDGDGEDGDDGEEDSENPPNIHYVKIVPGAGLMGEGERRAFFALGVTSTGKVIPMKNIAWEIEDESTAKIVEVLEDGFTVVVEGVSAGDFPNPNVTDLSLQYDLGYTDAEGESIILTDVVKVAVMNRPEPDAVLSGNLLDENGELSPDTDMLFVSEEIVPGMNLHLPARTDAEGKYVVDLVSGLEYSAIAFIPDESEGDQPTDALPDPGDSDDGGNPDDNVPRKAYTTTPDPYGPVSVGESSQNFTISEPYIPTGHGNRLPLFGAIRESLLSMGSVYYKDLPYFDSSLLKLEGETGTVEATNSPYYGYSYRFELGTPTDDEFILVLTSPDGLQELNIHQKSTTAEGEETSREMEFREAMKFPDGTWVEMLRGRSVLTMDTAEEDTGMGVTTMTGVIDHLRPDGTLIFSRMIDFFKVDKTTGNAQLVARTLAYPLEEDDEPAEPSETEEPGEPDMPEPVKIEDINFTWSYLDPDASETEKAFEEAGTVTRYFPTEDGADSLTLFITTTIYGDGIGEGQTVITNSRDEVIWTIDLNVLPDTPGGIEIGGTAYDDNGEEAATFVFYPWLRKVIITFPDGANAVIPIENSHISG